MANGDTPELIALERDIVKEGTFADYAQMAWPQIEAVPLVWGPHLQILSDHIDAFLEGHIKDLVVNVPPGTSKSSMVSVLMQPYAWIKWPWMKFLFTSYSDDLVGRFASRSQNLTCSEWHQHRWPECQIVGGDRANRGMYDSTGGGVRVSVAMGGQTIGKHAHRLIIDDPHKPKDLDGDVDSVKRALDAAWDIFTASLSTRRADAKSFGRMVIMQRLHEDDIAGRLLQLPGTVHLCLPMLYEPQRHCKTPWGEDWRTEPGQLLDPVRFPLEVVEADKAIMTPRAFASQHQQRPAPEEGGLLKRAYFENRWSVLPPHCPMYISVDCNLKDRKDADRAVIQVWAVVGSQYWCIDQLSGRWSVSEIVDQILKLRTKWPMCRNTLVEMKANGPAVVMALRGLVSGVIEIEPEGGKAARVEAVEWLLRANDVLFPAHNAPWVQALIEEAVTFPSAPHDDMLDAMTQFLVWAMTNGKGLAKWRAAMKAVRQRPGGGISQAPGRFGLASGLRFR